MSRILVAGVNGFVGKHLARQLQQQNCKVVGVGQEPSLHLELKGVVDTYLTCDLTDQKSVGFLPLEKIDGIINLAGLAQVGDSYKHPDLYKKVNVEVLDTLGQVLLGKNPKARLIAVSTGAVYDSNQAMPLTESSRTLTNGSPYALSKLLMEAVAKKLRDMGLLCVVARPFNHLGPGQAPGFILPDLFAKIMSYRTTGQPIKVGNLSTKRDYTDVRDVVKAYVSLALADKLSFDIYNICSGTSHSGQAIFDELLTNLGLKKKVTAELDPALLRPNDPMDLFGSNARLHRDIGWQPQIPIGQTIKDFVTYQQERA